MRRPDLPRVVLRSVALTEGLDDGELARMVRRQELLPLQRGAYLERPTDTAETRHCAVVAATVAGLRREAVVSHSSAAALHGLPLFRLPLGRVHLIRRPPASGSGSARVHLHVARLDPAETTSLSGVVLTDVTRTVVDLARSVPFESAVVAADAALAGGATTPDRLEHCLAAMGGVPVAEPRHGSSPRPTDAARASVRAAVECSSTGSVCPHRHCSYRSAGGTGR